MKDEFKGIPINLLDQNQKCIVLLLMMLKKLTKQKG